MKDESAESRLLNHFCNIDPVLAVQTMIRFPAGQAVQVFNLLNRKAQVDLLKKMQPYFASQIIQEFAPEIQSELLESLPLLYVAPILRQLPEENREPLLSRFSNANRNAILVVLKYEKDQAGALADPGIVVLRDSMTAKEVLEMIRQGPNNFTYYQYVVNDDNFLSGVISLKTLLRMPPDHQIAPMVHRRVISLKGNTRKDTIFNFPAWKMYPDLPVVDASSRLIGILRYRVIRHLQENQQVDLQPQNSGPVIEALGELNSIGLMSLLEGFVSILPEYETNTRSKES